MRSIVSALATCLAALCVTAPAALAQLEAPPETGGPSLPQDGYVRLLRGHALRAEPSTTSQRLAFLPSTVGGSPGYARVEDSTTDAEGRGWLRVFVPDIRGWMLASDTQAAARPQLSASLQRRLNAMIDTASSASGAIVTDVAGWTLWERRSATHRPLASNTKIFVVATGLSRYGRSLSAEAHRILIPSDSPRSQRLANRLGLRTIIGYAARNGAQLTLGDGSGLSAANQTNPRGVVRFLRALRSTSTFDIFYDSLPTAGVTGTLTNRMRDGAARGRCHAKTGTIIAVSNLSGFCEARSGRTLLFSILTQRTQIVRSRQQQDRMLNNLAASG